MKRLLSMTALGSLLTAVLFLAVQPAWAGNVDERIQALEQELAQLKSEQAQLQEEQIELKKDARAAGAKLPRFRYRPGSGLRIDAPDKSWAIRFRARLMMYMTFWVDDIRHNRVEGSAEDCQADIEGCGGPSQGVLQVRRARPRFIYYWDDRFYELDVEADVGGGSSGVDDTGGVWVVQHFEWHFRFDRLNPWLPELVVGPRTSGFLNPQDTNCSSHHCGRSERSMVNEGEGITTGTVERGIVLEWSDLPIGGPALIETFSVGYGIERADEFVRGNVAEVKNDNKSFHMGINIEPFAKSKSKWLKGIEVSYGGIFHQTFSDDFGGVDIRSNQTRFQRTRLIRTRNRDGKRVFQTVGFGWKVGPYQLRVAGQFGNSHREKTARADTGSSIQTRGFRIMHELWLWSKKGWFTGSRRSGGLKIVPMYQRADVEAPNGAMRSCDDGVSAECDGAYAVNAGVALWYFIGAPTSMNLGVVWDHWRVNKAHGGSRGVTQTIEKGKEGEAVNWNTVTLILRGRW